MEDFAFRLRLFLRGVGRFLTPHLRQVLRFIGLPYCYFFLVDWDSCTASRWQVVKDFCYIFFVLRYFPNNYSFCHFYELDREDWTYYYGSSYNPYQKGKLSREVQPTEFYVLFENKEVCQQLCVGVGIKMPGFFGVLDPDFPLPPQILDSLGKSSGRPVIAKPVSGASGKGIFMIRPADQGYSLERAGRMLDNESFAIKERFILQEVVEQHPDLARINSSSINSIRMLTFRTQGGENRVISASMRFGVGKAFIDNWSAGGLAIGVDLAGGCLLEFAYDEKGKRHERHTDSQVVFKGYPIPCWSEVMSFSLEAQAAFPYYKLLGLDVAVTPEGPVLLEINAFPDLLGNEFSSGPLLRDPDTHREFARYDLLINDKQKKLFQ